ncbi:unnamed protein product [Dracunculus medinensis]|uniref:Uncharacterized protein n=1 Tax=Dracunculus medinensis TaxID=318479 RepID=A0A0N4UMY6_DRAME|nr:unnamed protein product [Dracunculus medinensis]
MIFITFTKSSSLNKLSSEKLTFINLSIQNVNFLLNPSILFPILNTRLIISIYCTQHWPIFRFSILFLYHFIILQLISLV